MRKDVHSQEFDVKYLQITNYQQKNSPFYKGEVVSIREQLKQPLQNPKNIQKYQASNPILEELQIENAQLQKEKKAKEKEIQRLIAEKDMLLKSALSANQKLKSLKQNQINFSQDSNTSYSQNEKIRDLEMQLLRRDILLKQNNIPFENEEVTLDQDKTPSKNPYLDLKANTVPVRNVELQNNVEHSLTDRELQEKQELIDKIKKKDQAILNLLDIIKTNCSELYTNSFHRKFMQFIDNQITDQNQQILINQVNNRANFQQQERYLNIYRSTEEIFGFQVCSEPKSFSPLVFSQKFQGQIKQVGVIYEKQKCLQLMLKYETLDGAKSEFLYPDQVENQQKYKKFQFKAFEGNEGECNSIDEIWFHELQDEQTSILEADIKQTRNVIVDADLWSKLNSVYELKMKQCFTDNSLKLTDNYLLKSMFKDKTNWKLHDMIIYTDQNYFYGLMGVYIVNDQFISGTVMKGKISTDEQIEEQINSGIVAINKVKRNQYTKSRILFSIEYYQNEQSKIIEKIILYYQTLNNHNNTTTNLSCELGQIKSINKYKKFKIEIQKEKLIQSTFKHKFTEQPSDYILADIQMI